MPGAQQTNAESKVCKTLRRSGYSLLIIAILIGSWAVFGGAKSGRPLAPLTLSLLPVVLLFTALRLAKTALVCWIVLGTTAILVFGATYVYFNGFLVNRSSLNSILLLEIPVVQAAVALVLLTLVIVLERANRRSLRGS
jgi:hypothetical protein